MTELVCFVFGFFLLTLCCGHFLCCYLTFILNGCLCSLLWLCCDSPNQPSFKRKKNPVSSLFAELGYFHNLMG